VSLLCELRIKGFGQLERDHRHGKHPAASPSSYQLPNGMTASVGGLCAQLAAGTHANSSGLLHGAYLLALADPSTPQIRSRHELIALTSHPLPVFCVWMLGILPQDSKYLDTFKKLQMQGMGIIISCI
jgi:hypothetical protein